MVFDNTATERAKTDNRTEYKLLFTNFFIMTKFYFNLKCFDSAKAQKQIKNILTERNNGMAFATGNKGTVR
jgi:hypothetical protein